MKLVAAKDGVELSDSTAVKYTKRVPKEDDVKWSGGLKRTDESDPDGEKKPPAVANPPSKFVTAYSLLSSPSDDKNTLGDIPFVVPQASSTPQAFSVDNLGIAMKQEMMDRASPSSSNTRNSITLSPSSDDDEEIVFTPPRINLATTGQPRMGNHHGIYGYSYACKYLWTAHMGKNGPHTNEKVYDKDFMTKVWTSLQERNKRGAEGFYDKSLLCVELDIYGIHMMRDHRENRAKSIRYSNTGYVYFQMFSRILTKREIKEGKNNEAEMLKWLEKIRQAYLATKAQYPLKLEIGGVLGKHRAHIRALDTYMMDNDVATIAKLIYPKKIADGSLLNEVKRVNQFFSPWNVEAARDLLS